MMYYSVMAKFVTPQVLKINVELHNISNPATTFNGSSYVVIKLSLKIFNPLNQLLK